MLVLYFIIVLILLSISTTNEAWQNGLISPEGGIARAQESLIK